MRKKLVTAAAVAAVFGVAFCVTRAAIGFVAPQQPPDTGYVEIVPRPPWVRADGVVDESKVPEFVRFRDWWIRYADLEEPRTGTREPTPPLLLYGRPDGRVVGRYLPGEDEVRLNGE